MSVQVQLVGWVERTRNPASSSVATLERMLGFSLFIPAYDTIALNPAYISIAAIPRLIEALKQ